MSRTDGASSSHFLRASLTDTRSGLNWKELFPSQDVIYHYQIFKCKSVGVILQSEVYSLPCGSILESSFVKFFPRLKSLFLILLLDGCGGLGSIVRILQK